MVFLSSQQNELRRNTNEAPDIVAGLDTLIPICLEIKNLMPSQCFVIRDYFSHPWLIGLASWLFKYSQVKCNRLEFWTSVGSCWPSCEAFHIAYSGTFLTWYVVRDFQLRNWTWLVHNSPFVPTPKCMLLFMGVYNSVFFCRSKESKNSASMWADFDLTLKMIRLLAESMFGI